MTVSRQLFFAWEAQKWDGGGVAFLSPVESRDASTICRLYKITVEQFEDVHMAEAGAEDPRPLDLVDLITKGSLPQYDRLYGLALHLGTHDGSPVITLTTERTDLAENCPSVGYAATIARGLVECTMMTAEEAVDYVLATRGVDQRLDRGKLLQLTSSTS